MKKYILLGSVGSGSIATLLGLAAVSENGPRIVGYAVCFGLLAVALFFVGAVFPKDL